MSRIGKVPIQIPSGVTVEADNDFITVNGPKGSLKQFTMPGVKVAIDDGQVVVSRINDEALNRGVGYRVQPQGADLKFNLGFSHDVIYNVPPSVQVKVEQNTITVSGSDKQQVGQVAAEIRALKKPEPYKGKGIKYADERIIRKSGKSGKE
jgi:large subunit ribosomal protein L6